MTIQGCTFRALGKIRAVRPTELRQKPFKTTYISLRPTGLHLSEGTIFFHTSAGGLQVAFIRPRLSSYPVLPGPTLPHLTCPELRKGSPASPGSEGRSVFGQAEAGAVAS
jgi:hypothetical protein